MIKTNYKPTEKITIIKPGIFNNQDAEIISVDKSEKCDKPIKADLGQGGIWCFAFTEVQSKSLKK